MKFDHICKKCGRTFEDNDPFELECFSCRLLTLTLIGGCAFLVSILARWILFLEK
jgi:hypothetical protein